MTIQKVEIDIPDGYEFVRYDKPKEGELFLDADDAVIAARFTLAYSKHVIVRKSWKWPPWLKYDWVAQDHNGKWYAFENEPSRSASTWHPIGDFVMVSSRRFDFTPPPCDDWRQSLRRNPNAVV